MLSCRPAVVHGKILRLVAVFQLEVELDSLLELWLEDSLEPLDRLDDDEGEDELELDPLDTEEADEGLDWLDTLVWLDSLELESDDTDDRLLELTDDTDDRLDSDELDLEDLDDWVDSPVPTPGIDVELLSELLLEPLETLLLDDSELADEILLDVLTVLELDDSKASHSIRLIWASDRASPFQ